MNKPWIRCLALELGNKQKAYKCPVTQTTKTITTEFKNPPKLKEVTTIDTVYWYPCKKYCMDCINWERDNKK